MLKKIGFLWLMLVSLSVFSQNFDKALVEKQFTEYNQLLMNKDFKNAMNYINDGMFKYLPKKGMIQLMEQTFKNPNVKMSIVDSKIESISDELITVKDTHYAKIKYRQNISMKFVKKDKNMTKEVIMNALETDFGKGNVTYHPKTDSYQIKAQKNAVANSKDLQKWKFTVVEKKLNKLLQKFLPKEVM